MIFVIFVAAAVGRDSYLVSATRLKVSGRRIVFSVHSRHFGAVTRKPAPRLLPCYAAGAKTARRRR